MLVSASPSRDISAGNKKKKHHEKLGSSLISINAVKFTSGGKSFNKLPLYLILYAIKEVMLVVMLTH